MIPSITAVRLTGARHRTELPLLVLGPALGMSATTLWSACAAGLTDVFDVLAWDLPGHGHNRGVPEEPFTMAELATGVLRTVDDVLTERGQPRGPFFCAGHSVGGAVGLQLSLDAPDRLVSVALLGTGARVGSEELEAETMDEGYAQVCGALAAYDVREELGRVGVPVLAVAGRADVTTPPDQLREIADGVKDGRYVELDGVARLAPVEAPEVVARLLREHFLGEAPAVEEPPGMQVRREVLGNAHVDRAIAETTDLTRDFQELLTAYAWGEVWSRPGLDRRSRSMITLTALIARGHHEEVAIHVRGALRNGLSVEEIKEVILHSAVYCGVPAARTAFRIASEVLTEEGLL